MHVKKKKIITYQFSSLVMYRNEKSDSHRTGISLYKLMFVKELVARQRALFRSSPRYLRAHVHGSREAGEGSTCNRFKSTLVPFTSLEGLCPAVCLPLRNSKTLSDLHHLVSYSFANFECSQEHKN